MQQGLTDENRGSVFAPAVPVADEASAYDRLGGVCRAHAVDTRTLVDAPASC